MISSIRCILMHSDTLVVRLFLSFISILTSISVLYTCTIDHEYAIIQLLAPKHIWSILFLIYSIALFYGVITKKFSTALLLVEAVLGATIWTAYSISMFIAVGIPDGTLGVALIAIWLLVRYPTHWEYSYE